MGRCCRNCYRYRAGRCTHPFMLDIMEPRYDLLPVERVSEDGVLREAIQEEFTEKIFKSLIMHLAEAKLSQKKQKAIMNNFYQELEDKQNEWALEIDEVICRILASEEEKDKKIITIPCPDEMCCEYFE